MSAARDKLPPQIQVCQELQLCNLRGQHSTKVVAEIQRLDFQVQETVWKRVRVHEVVVQLQLSQVVQLAKAVRQVRQLVIAESQPGSSTIWCS